MFGMLPTELACTYMICSSCTPTLPDLQQPGIKLTHSGTQLPEAWKPPKAPPWSVSSRTKYARVVIG